MLSGGQRVQRCLYSSSRVLGHCHNGTVVLDDRGRTVIPVIQGRTHQAINLLQSLKPLNPPGHGLNLTVKIGDNQP